MDEIPNKFSRYAKTSKTAAGLTARYLGKKVFNLSGDDESSAKLLREALGSLKGPLMKVAQILSTIPDMLPEEYREELSQLQSNAPPMGPLFVKRRMRNELGMNWETLFKEFDKTPMAAASLGQVHKAISHEGDPLAVKLQYPDMDSIIETDLQQLKTFLGLYHKFGKSLDTENMFQEIQENLKDELDYHKEAGYMGLFSRITDRENLPALIPKVHPSLSTSKILTVSYLEGTPLKGFLERPDALLSLSGENLFKTWYTPFYKYGVLHGDPHAGNYKFNEDGNISLFDFGCTRIFSPQFIEGVIHLYHALRDHKEDLAAEAYRCWGFEALTKDRIALLNEWARYLYDPLLDDRPRLIEETLSSRKGQEIAGKILKDLRKDGGGLKPPREFVLVDRAAVGIGSVLMHLKARANWHQLFEGMIEGFSKQALSQKQSLVIPPAQNDSNTPQVP